MATTDAGIYPAQAGSPQIHHYPENDPKSAWTPLHREAIFEQRKTRSLKRGSSAKDADAEAQYHLERALTRGLMVPQIYVHNHLHGHAEGSELAGTWHTHPHAHLAGQPHPSPTLHHHIHTGALDSALQEKLLESFSWMTPFTIVADGIRRIIKGVAITVGKTKNRSKYTHDELLRGARTLAGKQMLINHIETPDEAAEYLQGRRSDGSTFDPATIPPLVHAAIQSMTQRGSASVGAVFDSEFEGEGVEYVGAVADPAAVKVVDANLVKGVSIGAIPRNKDIQDPRGIMFEDLSLITDPEQPGDPDATMKVIEKLMEMVTERQPTYTLREVARELHPHVDAELIKRRYDRMDPRNLGH